MFLKKAGFININQVVGDKFLPNKMPYILQHKCLFLDINMPEMDGVEVIRDLAKYNYSGKLILFSGENEDLLKSSVRLAESNDLNVLGFLPKPASLSNVNKILTRSSKSKGEKNYNVKNKYTKLDLEKALEKNEFLPYFQPKISVRTKEIEGYEVLARWQKKNGTILGPNLFIPLLEEFDLIHQFTIYLFDQTIQELKNNSTNENIIPISFNISAYSLEDLNLPDILANIMKKHEMSNNLVTIEITESTVVDKLSISLDVLTRIRIKGFGLSIDDFGTGYSSMELLHKIPFTELKIDRQFVHNANKDRDINAILEFCSSLAKKLNLKIVAEGVENNNDWISAKLAGCDEIQGYYISKPMPLKNIRQWQKGYTSEINKKTLEVKDS